MRALKSPFLGAFLFQREQLGLNLWGLIGAAALALCWLLPNHQVPWTAFHADVWSAGILLFFTGFCLFKRHKQTPWSYLSVVVAGLCLWPLFQLGLGQIALSGTAWIGTSYMVGLLLAVLVGARWQASKAGELQDILFAAIGIAATISVTVQLCQWLRVDDGCFCRSIWIAEPDGTNRLSANLGQPNQMATLLVWGMLAYGWAWQRASISAGFATTGSAFLLIGLAMTQSRTGAVAVGLVVLCAWFWRSLLPSNTAVKTVTALGLGYVALLVLLPYISSLLLLDYTSNIAARTKFETRFDIWAMFLSAAWQQPWIGYGWGQTLLAQIMPTTVIPQALTGTGTYYAHAHNLFLDLIIWLGIPLGVTVSIGILFWVARAIAAVKTSQDALAVMLVLTVGLHAMLELPLHYAYFLLPFGLVVGTLDVSVKALNRGVVGQKTMACVFALATLLFTLVVRDYFAAEESYNRLRLERARILTNVPRTAPDVVLLTQLRDFIVVARLEPSPHMTSQQMDLVEGVALAYPNVQNMIKMTTSMIFQGRIREAQQWLSRICQISTAETCTYAKGLWGSLQIKFTAIRDVPWPTATR